MRASLATLGAGLLAAVSIWFAAVNREVPHPYLDEYFHVRQGGLYCQGRFDTWDPKITTPPGLYLLSYLLSPVFKCEISALRLVNALCLPALFIVVYASYIERRKSNNEIGFSSVLLAQHSALNTVLLPPSFFFSALYYTDVPSTLSVMIFYWYFIRVWQNGRSTFGQGCVQVLLGTVSLWFRQTNIFWVAVAPIGLLTIVRLDRGHQVIKHSMYKHAEGFGDSMFSVVKTTWKMDAIHDPPVRSAQFEDYLRTVASILTRGMKVLTQPTQLVDLLQALAPYLTLVALFIAFVLWNGGVVLGDRSAHVATLHLAQLLYLWPYIAFFSWPLLLPHALILPLVLLARLSELAHIEPLLFFKRCVFTPRPMLLAAAVGVALLIVRFNTIVHPYTLADNRHFTFYIFKRLLHPHWLRYAVTPIYVLCAWACFEIRGEAPAPAAAKTSGSHDDGEESKTTSARDAAKTKEAKAGREPAPRPLQLPDGSVSATTSFVLIILATTTLQLVTAPLVEPRYFIIPWMMWRIHLPLGAGHASPRGRPVPRAQQTWKAIARTYDYRVVLETAWLLFLNVVIGYVFLYRTFTWVSEPGDVQRFIW